MAELAGSNLELAEQQPHLLPPHEFILGNTELPIANHREEIEKSILENSVTIIVAPTGSGKTTQVPQFARDLLLEADGEPLFDEIIVTQPRIVAARSVSERVAEEIAGANRNDSVGYYTSKEGTADYQSNQDIAFLTDGKAAAQLLHASNRPNPETNRLLIIDEVHEWNLNTEQLIAIATEKTNPNSKMYDPNFKVVLMSATMDAKGLQQHFEDVAPPIITVHVPTYEVTRTVSNKAVANVALSVAQRTRGKVLTFLPGKREIHKVADHVGNKQQKLDDPIPVVPLHGQQTAEEQGLAFLDYEGGSIVATTNAAETSLTVPGAVAVVDSGEVRVDRINYDLIHSGSEGLYLENAPQANLNQRAGRVGRTAPGEYILASPEGKAATVPPGERPEYADPAMERTRLDGLLLQLKATGHEISDFRFFHTPPPEAVKAAQKRLFNLGAIDESGKITERGIEMNKLPLDPEYSCMVVFSYEQEYSDEVKQNVLDIASIMQLGGILKRAPKEQAWRMLLKTDETGELKENESDFIAQLEAYIQLLYSVDQENWGDFDIIEYAAGNVERTRATLADRLDVKLHHPTEVADNDRDHVMACINAGQLNQLWWFKNGNLTSVLEPSQGFEIAKASVARSIGELATGTLFTLGLGHTTFHNVQNLNAVASRETLVLVAGHLIREVVDEKRAKYDPESRLLVANVNRMIGNFVLNSYRKPLDSVGDNSTAEKLRGAYREHSWDLFRQENNVRAPYSLDDIDAALEEPESAVYGTDPVTGEELIAYKGGNGQWCTTKEIALKSLESRKVRLIREPIEAAQRELKSNIQTVSNALVALKRDGHSVNEIKRLMKMKKKITKEDWLAEAQTLLESAEVAA